MASFSNYYWVFSRTLFCFPKSSKFLSRAFIFCALAYAAVWPNFVTLAMEQVSLPEVVRRAEQNQILQKDLDAIIKGAKAKITQVQMQKWLSTFELQVFTGIVPDVNADSAVSAQSADQLLFGIKSDDDFSLSGMGGFAKVEVKAVQPLWTFGKISGYEDMADYGLEIAEQEKKKEIDQVRFLVKKAFYTLQLSLDGLAILKDVIGKLKDAEQKVEELLIKNAENVEENDRLKIKVFLADVESRSLDALKGLKLSRSALSELAGMSGDWEPEMKSLGAELVQGIEKEAVISQALRGQPQLVRLTKYIDVKKAERQTIRADLFPSFFLAGQLEYGVAPGRTDVTNPYLSDPFNSFNPGVALGLKQDLGIHRTFNRIDQIDAEIARLGAQKQRFTILVRLKAEEAFEKAAMAQRGIQISENGFRAARSWLTSTGLAFNLGTASTKDVLESYAAYFKGRVDLLRRVYELNIALSELSLASGVELVERLKSQ